MARINWPTYSLTPTITERVELEGASIQLIYPGQKIVKAEFSNEEQVFNTSEGEWKGTITIAFQNRNSEAHIKIQTLLEQLKTDPKNNWTLVDWQRPSIFTLGSTVGRTNLIAGFDNNRVASISAISSGIATMTTPPAGGGETVTVTPGEHFGFTGKTYKIVSANRNQNAADQWFIRTVPDLEDDAAPAAPLVYKRNLLAMRMVAGQTVPDFAQGNQAGPWSFEVIEFQGAD